MIDPGSEFRRWFSAAMWIDWYRLPPKQWWVLPSGIGPGPYVAADYLGAPLISHTLFGAWAFGIGWLITGAMWPAYAVVLAMAIYGQVQKADALKEGYGPWGTHAVQNMFWRTLITAVTLGTVLLFFS